MKRKSHKKHLIVLVALLASCGTAIADNDEAAADSKIDGFYAALPSAASEPVQMTVGLGELLPVEKFEHVKISGKLERFKIESDYNSLRVIAYDSADHAVVDEVVQAECTQKSGHTEYRLERQWQLPGSGESGAATGTMTFILSKDEDGNLLADVTTVSVGQGFFSSKTPTKSHSWMKYRSVAGLAPPPAPESPSKKKEDGSPNSLFGRQ
jgi:hypothetical protein